MSEPVQQVQSRGIYHALPVFPNDDAHTNLTAIVTGANGISGYYMLRVLAAAPERWSKIYCLSRRPPYIDKASLPSAADPKRIEHISCDFLKTPEEIASTLQSHGIKTSRPTYVFFYSYLQPAPLPGQGLWSDANEMCRVNAALLSNFLGALKLANIAPERFMLQTGAKNYGVHLGPTTVPQYESAQRVEFEPNFYYPQEDLLWKYCAESSKTGWNVHMPGAILGAVPDAAMNAAFPLAVYAVVSRELGEPLRFPADVASWQMHCDMSSAMMNALQEEWAVLTPSAKDQKFNTCDGSAFAWEGFWPMLAKWYGLAWEGPQDGAKYVERESRFNPRGYGGKGVTRRAFSLVDWAKQSKVQEAWKKIAERDGLAQKELVDIDRVFGFLDRILTRVGQIMYSMDKCRKLGWHGFVDTRESLREVFEDLAKIKMIPTLPSQA